LRSNLELGTVVVTHEYGATPPEGVHEMLHTGDERSSILDGCASSSTMTAEHRVQDSSVSA
jgi:hypothetical protein